MANTTKKHKRGKQPAETTYQQVEEMVARKKISRSEAFRELAKQIGRSPGSLQVAYYRAARRRRGGGPALTRTGKRRGRPRSGGGPTSTVLERANNALRDLAGLVRQQQAEIEQLRKKATRIDELRRVLGVS